MIEYAEEHRIKRLVIDILLWNIINFFLYLLTVAEVT